MSSPSPHISSPVPFPPPSLVGPHGRRAALLIHNFQRDYISGSVAIPGAAELAKEIERLRKDIPYHHIVFINESHPVGHCSFISSGESCSLLVAGSLQSQHCLAGSAGEELPISADFSGVRIGRELLLKVGIERSQDSFSAFHDFSSDSATQSDAATGLLDILRNDEITDLHIVGLGHNPFNSALEGRKLGFNVYLLPNLCLLSSVADHSNRLIACESAGVIMLNSAELSVSGRSDRRIEAAQYLEKHGVAQLFDYLFADSLVRLSKNPALTPAAALLEALQNAPSKPSGSKSLFSDDDYDTLFTMLDVLRSGSLIRSQVFEALRRLGGDQRKLDTIEIPEKVDRTQFKAICANAAKM